MLTTYVLANDIVRKRGFLAEHGLSLLIRSDHRTVLFDVGQSGIYISNAMKLGLDIAKADSIVLSHGHYDHCGGLEYFPVSDGNPDVYIRSEALEEKFAENPDGSFRNVGIPLAARESTVLRKTIHPDAICVEIYPGFFILGRITSQDKKASSVHGLFVKNGNNFIPDNMYDEQLLVVGTGHGIVVYLGCSHPGIVECIDHVRNNFPGEKILSVYAGMHLDGISESALDSILSYLESADIGKIFPLHCTGVIASAAIKRRFKDRCEILYTGDVYEQDV